MIDKKDVLGSFRQELVKPLAAYRPPPLAPLPISPWCSMSLLQKAIRRSEKTWAVGAAATLLIDAPDKLWRRLAGIAAEDVGLADICATGATVGMMAGKRMRASLGGEWAVAAWLTQRLCAASKSRATDDLLMTVQLLPGLQGERERLADLSNHHLRLILLGTDSLHARALALLYLAGTAGKPIDQLASRRGEPALPSTCSMNWGPRSPCWNWHARGIASAVNLCGCSWGCWQQNRLSIGSQYCPRIGVQH